MILKASDIISLVSAILAVIALFVGLYAAIVTQRVATSGFRAAEEVKIDTARLLTALRSLMLKGVLYTQQDPKIRDDASNVSYIDIDPEKQQIQQFMLSSTALAYYSLVADRSRKAREEKREGEEWRVFFLRLGDLLHKRNPYAAAVLAAEIEKMLDGISDDDIEEMSGSLEDIPGSVSSILSEREHDVIFHVLVDRRERDAYDDALFRDFLVYLESKAIMDPDVVLFSGVVTNDLEKTKKAAEAGANLSVTTGEIISRYRKEFDEFKQARDGKTRTGP